MAFVFEDEEPQGGQFVFEDEAPQQPKAVTMEQARGRSLPATWDVEIGGQPFRGVFDSDANAYLVSDRMGQAYYINKDASTGALGLKPYKGKASAAEGGGEMSIAGIPVNVGEGARNFWAGAGKAAVDTKRGIKQLGTLAGNTLGLVSDEAVDQSFADAQELKARDADLMDTKAGIAGNVAGNVASAALGGATIKGAGQGIGAIGRASAASTPTASTVASVAGNALSKAGSAVMAPKSFNQAAAAGAAIGASQPSGSLDEKGLQTGLGALAGLAGQAVTKGVGKLASGSQSIRQEVKDLARVAQEKWGISVGNDKLVKSKALDALAAGAEYVPFSGMGKAAVNRQKQFNQAIAKTIGQTSDNPAHAIKKADEALGDEFDRVLQGTAVKADDAFQSDMAKIMEEARAEMTDQQFGVMQRQVDDILKKVGEGDLIDAQAAYNIKKRLDRLGNNQDDAIANYATDLKRSMMEALGRSLGPKEAAKFANTRAQYSNLINLRKVVPRGAEADISPAKLANLRGYMTDDLNELADIAATFLKPREGNSGTMPRLAGMATLGGAGTTAAFMPSAIVPTALAGVATVAGGKGANYLVNSPRVGKLLLEGSKVARKAERASRAAPVALPAFLESYLQSQR